MVIGLLLHNTIVKCTVLDWTYGSTVFLLLILLPFTGGERGIIFDIRTTAL